jgi:hypothetical protein
MSSTHDETPTPVTENVKPTEPTTPSETKEEAPAGRFDIIDEGESDDTGFVIPDAYKDKPWAKDVKSTEDLFARLDGTVKLPDFEKGTKEEIEAFHNTFRPKEAKDYVIPEVFEDKEPVANMLYESGLSKVQADALLNKYAAYTQARLEKETSKEGFVEVLKGHFGEEYMKPAGDTAKFLSANLNADEKTILDHLPNNVVGLIYKTVGNVLKQYGAEPSKAITGVDNTPTPVVDKKAEFSRLFKMAR